MPTLIKGAMLHDFYLYDWHAQDNGEHRWHGYHHAEKAREIMAQPGMTLEVWLGAATDAGVTAQ